MLDVRAVQLVPSPALLPMSADSFKSDTCPTIFPIPTIKTTSMVGMVDRHTAIQFFFLLISGYLFKAIVELRHLLSHLRY